MEATQRLLARRAEEPTTDRAIADVAARNKPVIVVGGTGLYVRALLYGLFQGPAADPVLRARLASDALATAGEAGASAWLWQRLEKVDPVAASRIDARDERRLLRALEVYETTGRPISEHQRAHDYRSVPARYPARVLGLCPERAELHERIHTRVDEMMAAGWLDEVRRLLAVGYGPDLRSFAALGYRELCAHLRQEISLSETVERVKKQQRRYARRQLVWFRAERDVTWYKAASWVDIFAFGAWITGT